VRKRLISRRLTAIASATPRCSLSMPGKAPGVSISVTTGRENFSAKLMARKALR